MIFEDPSSKRWKITIAVFACIVIAAIVLFANFAYIMMVDSPLLPLSKINPDRGKYIANTTQAEVSTSATVIPTSSPKPTIKPTRKPNSFPSKVLERPFKDTFVRSAFMLQGDPVSVADMKKHINEIDIIFPDWLEFVNGKVEINEIIEADLLTYLKSQKAMIFPRLANIDIDGNWFGEDFGKFIKSSDNRSELSLLIVNTLKKYDLKGINIDVEEITPESGNDYLEFLYELAQFMHKDGLYLTVDVPMNDEAFDYEAIGQIADFVIVMAYDEHFTSGTSGAIASFDWFNEGIDDMAQKIPKEKLIIAAGQYSYEWNASLKTPATVLSFDETMLLAKDVGADVQTDDQNINSYFSYKDELGQIHNVWMLDAISMWNQLQAIHKTNLAGISLWRLGSEDPTIWGFYRLRDSSSFSPQSLSKVSTLNFVGYDGRGEILKVAATPVEGSRILSIEKNIIEYADYDKLPTNYQVHEFGHNDKKEIVLTFDDGPDQIYTNKILDILKANNITATFFIVGDQAQRNVQVVKRIYKEGSLVGNHTFNHPDLSRISDARVRLELNSVQRFLEAILGRQMLLFRAPYSADSNPSTPSELAPLYIAGQMGYAFVGADIDSKDYEKPGVDKIVQTIQEQLKATGSNIIVMHDAGGNRQQTVDSLKILIPLLKKEGYMFVNINDLLGVSKESLMPKITSRKMLLYGRIKFGTS
jgi:spore germination protein YaaH/peptidoglycan/xylan/chitin deacetylase (PgdA/CDA1 family)